MRNRKSYSPQKKPEQKAAPTAPVIERNDALASEVRALRKTIEQAAGQTPAVSGVNPAEMQNLIVSLERSVARPRQMAVEVIRDNDGRVTGMIGTTDEAEIDRISKQRPHDEAAQIEEWISKSLS